MGRPRVGKRSRWLSLPDMQEAFGAQGYNMYEVLRTIKCYSREGLDISWVPSCQQPAIRKIQQELEKQFTGIFEGDSGSALEEMVRRYIVRLHTSRRYHSRARGQSKDSSGDASDDDDDEEDEEDSDVEFVAPAVTMGPPRQNFRVSIVASPTLPVAAATSTSNSVRASERRFSSQSVPQSISSTTSQPSINHRGASSSRPSLIRNHGVVAVERFLDNCLPSMVHFLERFLSYGCQDPQFLLAVSTLPRDSIVDLLRSLPCLGGRVMTEMEVFLLTEHFVRYSQ